MKSIITTLIFLAIFIVDVSGQAFTESTFHCISLYWSPVGGAASKDVLVEYKVNGTATWYDGLSMKYNPIAGVGLNPVTGLRYDKADYRGSLVDLITGETYDVRLTLEGTATTTTIQASTWEEEFPIGTTITPGNLTTRYNVPQSGTANAYLLIDGTGDTIDVQDQHPQCIRLIDKSYVIIRGYVLKNASEDAIRLFDCHHIVIEDCDISGWGEEDVAGTGFGRGYQAGVYAGTNDGHHCVIQRNKIHHPRWDTNSWAELHDPNDDPGNPDNYHPDGPQAIGLGQNYIGNNVIRYNEMWSDADHYFNDIVGLWANGSYAGFPGPDSDIYGNYMANCWDDGIESEGSNTNVRIWANYIEETFIPIANAATSIGPLYVWKNISGRTNSLPNSVYGQYGPFLKLGYANSKAWMTGQSYVFNNTILQPGDHGAGGLGTTGGSNRYIQHLQSLNNILHVRNVTTNSISTGATNIDFEYDYDLLNKGYPVTEENHGIDGTPTYEAGAPTIDLATKMGNFKLDPSSDGYDDGILIPNFMDSFAGIAPDMGAHQHGTPLMEFGVNAIYPIAPKYINWIGVVSIDWDNPSNWGGGLLPDHTSHVYIPQGTPFQPSVNLDATIRKLTVATGASVNVLDNFLLEVLEP